MATTAKQCDDPFCQGIVIEVTDKNLLAKSVAWALAQQYRAARRIVDGETPIGNPTNINAKKIIAERLRTTDNEGKQSDAMVYHRDGLLFQLIMWLVSHKDALQTDLVQQPHIVTAGKGIDGTIVHLQSGTQVAAVSICEDKATDNPRTTITEVFEDIKETEKGARDDLLRAVASNALVGRGVDEEQAELTAGSILWTKSRRYRIRTIVGLTHANPPIRGRLFKGFEDAVKGGKEKRRGETMYIDDLRGWMQDFATLVQQHLLAI